ncbi:hypothetical protein ACWDTG_23165 [Rhodococcus zopfii]|uniref:hypothetical protein n=1 Tax=Rhodococcus zopfii TaxID=43772 RepID=UPI003B8A6138
MTVAPIASTNKGLSTEEPVGPANGLGHDCVVSSDNIQTIPATSLGRTVGFLYPEQEAALAESIRSAFE